jgi:DNA processing protein
VLPAVGDNMDPTLAGRWAVLARWSDRLDPRELLASVAGDPSCLDVAALRASRASPGFIRAWQAAEPLELAPWTWIGHSDYPAALLDLPRPPPALWLRGDPAALRGDGLAVVGSRSCTPYGRRTARALGRAITTAGGVVVSGGARGVDSEAHLGAADAGASVAVLGAGLMAPLGGAGRRLRDHVVATGGALITELPPWDPPTRWTFPRRNRLIAALGRVTVVVEAGVRSGAGITARLAGELGRDVYAVPGPIGAPASAGCLRLLADGALVVESLGTVADLVLPTVPRPGQRLLDALVAPLAVGELATRLGLSLPETLRSLALLELGGAVTRGPGGRYARRS